MSGGAASEVRRVFSAGIWGLMGIAIAAWSWLLYQTWTMNDMVMADMAMPSTSVLAPIDLWLIFLMWAVMMTAMMVPSATQMVLLFDRMSQERTATAWTFLTTWAFSAGYLVDWIAFAVIATLAQWQLHTAALMSPTMVATSPVLGGLLLIAAGLYQWTPLKYACLTRCRSPLSFLLQYYRAGRWGAFTMGLRHGLYCIGCCCLLMSLLFVMGVMNILWIGTLTALILFEKLLPHGVWIARVAGVALIIWGGWVLVIPQG